MKEIFFEISNYPPLKKSIDFFEIVGDAIVILRNTTSVSNESIHEFLQKCNTVVSDISAKVVSEPFMIELTSVDNDGNYINNDGSRLIGAIEIKQLVDLNKRAIVINNIAYLPIILNDSILKTVPNGEIVKHYGMYCYISTDRNINELKCKYGDIFLNYIDMLRYDVTMNKYW